MNADIPYLHCWVQLPHISDRTGVEEAYAFAIQSVKGRAIGFHCMLKSGAHYRNVPLHAISLTQGSATRSLENLAYWDCFTSKPAVTVFDYLKAHECNAYLPDHRVESGEYLFTVDWLPDDSAHPGWLLEPDQNKCGHVIALESGSVAMLPTNKIAWKDGYFIGAKPSPQKNGYTAQHQVYRAESCQRDFSRTSDYFYADRAEPSPCQDSSQTNSTLTDEEREAVKHFAKEFKGKNAATLLGLLERTK
jgi:hypothetical protein